MEHHLNVSTANSSTGDGTKNSKAQSAKELPLHGLDGVVLVSDRVDARGKGYVRPPPEIKRVAGSWCGEVVSQPFCLYYQAS